MKIKITRPNLYLIIMSTFLLIFVLLFSFLLLIPKGKNYRMQKIEFKKEMKQLRQLEDLNSEKVATLKDLRVKNRRVIDAFDAKFSVDRFDTLNSKYFDSLTISKVKTPTRDDEFDIYEVNTSSQISSPKSFYNFLDSINKGEWIIAVNLPVHFKRESELIKSSFTMKVYCSTRDSNGSKVSLVSK